MSSRFPQVRINLVEQKGWDPWDTGGELVERASDAAHEDFFHMDLRTLKDLISDMAGGDLMKGRTGPKEWSPRKKTLSDDDLAWLASQVKEGDNPFLEDTRYSILDAMTWMYEEAMTPSDGDIRDAIFRMVEYAQDHYDIDEELWEPIIGEEPGKVFDPAVAEDLARNVEYQRQTNYYDRYLVFNLSEANVVPKLFAASEWPKKQIISRLKEEFSRFQKWYMDHFWHALHKEFDDVEIENRTNWKKQWKAMLAMDSQMKVVRQELPQAIREREAPDA